MIVQLYSTPSCGKCMLAENILNGKVEYLNIKDTSTVIAKTKELNIMEMPILVVNGQPFSGREAVIKANEIVEIGC